MPIYRDSVGRPNSKAVISVFGSFYGQPGTGGRLVLSTVSDAPKAFSNCFVYEEYLFCIFFPRIAQARMVKPFQRIIIF